MTASVVARVNWPPRFYGISRLHLSGLRLWLCSSAVHPMLFTGVRGIGILRSSVLLAAFSTMGAIAPVGSVRERRKRHDVCRRTSRQQGEGTPLVGGGLRPRGHI